MMKIQVKLFALLREIVERSEVALEVPPGISCGEVFFYLREQFPALWPLLEHCLVAVNGNRANRGFNLSAGDEVAILPPVSGG